MIKVLNGVATREPLPAFLVGLAPESLVDLSWTDPALGVQSAAWWPEESGDAELPEGYKWGVETLTPDAARQVVVVTRDQVPMTDAEIVASRPARHITQLAFLSRFTDAEAIAIDLASQGATPQAAAMRRYQAKVNAATYIDLDRQDTRVGVQALEAGGLLAPGRAFAILDGAIVDHERWRGV